MEEQELIDAIIKHPSVLQTINDRCKRYKKEGKYFCISVEFYYDTVTGSVKTDINDMSYLTRKELKISIESWANGRLQDINSFMEKIWNNRNSTNISVLALFETDDIHLGRFTLINVN